MKKLLLTLFLCVMMLGGAFAQFRFGNYPVIGMSNYTTITTNPDTLLVHFNTNTVNSTYTATALALLKCQTQRGIQCYVYNNSTTTTAVQSGNFKGGAYGGNGNPVHVASMDSLLKIMAKSSSTPTPTNGNLADSLTQPAHCLFDVSAGNQAFGVYPGRYKHVEYGYQVDFTGKSCTKDITFEIDTYNAGTTGKSASYELAVYSGTTISDANLIGTKKADYYVTGSGKKYVSLAADLGVSIGSFSNKKVCFFLRTQGTSNDLGVVDGLPNATTGATHIPVTYDPTIVFDNFSFIYGSSSWTYPAGVVANAVFNHSNGSPEVTISTDFSGGTAKIVAADKDYPVKINFTSVDRIGSISIIEANDGGGHAAGFGFAATGAVKKKDAAGTYTTDVTYTYSVDPTTSKFTLTIPAPSTGSTNDTLEITLLANVPLGSTRTERLELTNGVRFWYNVGVTGDLGTGINGQNELKAVFFGNNNRIMGTNVIENVNIFSANGQLIRTAKAEEMNAGIQMNTGLYIVKSGADVQKVLVK
jgi:hypothetical protein